MSEGKDAELLQLAILSVCVFVAKLCCNGRRSLISVMLVVMSNVLVIMSHVLISCSMMCSPVADTCNQQSAAGCWMLPCTDVQSTILRLRLSDYCLIVV